MAARVEELNEKLIAFIEAQQLFFVGTAAPHGPINVSPKGGDCLKVLSNKQILWLNYTGSGNETAAHLKVSDRMTLMFCAFDGSPLILRCYGRATAIHPRDELWQKYSTQLPSHPSARQLIILDLDFALTSCGFGVPFYDHVGPRDNMDKWLARRDENDIHDYWREKNQVSLDGLPTGIFEDEKD